MKEDEVRKTAFAMPLTSPAYARPPFRFVNREFIIVTYPTDPAALAAVVPEPLLPADPVVKLPVLEVLSAIHILTDLSQVDGEVVHDDLRAAPV